MHKTYERQMTTHVPPVEESLCDPHHQGLPAPGTPGPHRPNFTVLRRVLEPLLEAKGGGKVEVVVQQDTVDSWVSKGGSYVTLGKLPGCDLVLRQGTRDGSEVDRGIKLQGDGALGALGEQEGCHRLLRSPR